MLTELFEKYGNQKPMDLGTAVERTIPVSAVIKMMEEYHEGKFKNLDILHVSNSVKIALLKQLEELSDYIPAEIYTKKVIEIKSNFNDC